MNTDIENFLISMLLILIIFLLFFIVNLYNIVNKYLKNINLNEIRIKPKIILMKRFLLRKDLKYKKGIPYMHEYYSEALMETEICIIVVKQFFFILFFLSSVASLGLYFK